MTATLARLALVVVLLLTPVWRAFREVRAEWLYLVALAFAVGLFAAPLVRAVALRFRVLDLPAERKVHEVATPLLGGAALQHAWLLWMSPLLLLLALQLLWHESTIFDVLREGDWGRLVCAALSGLIVGNLGVAIYGAAGGMTENNLLSAQSGYLLFGLLCLQLGDVIAEQWRGKTRAQVFKKKPFPIPVVKK